MGNVETRSDCAQRGVLVALLLGALSGTSHAQDATSTCLSAYDNNLSQIVITENSFSELHSVFDNYCTQSGEVRASTGATGFEVVAKKIPIKFQQNNSSSEQIVRSFCRDYREVRYSTEYANIQQSEPVLAAMEMFNQCVNIAIESTNGLSISHKLAGPGSLSIYFKFWTGNIELSLQGVSTSDNFECWSNSPQLSWLGRKVILNHRRSYSITRDLTIVCDRRKKSEGNSDDSSESYSPGWINMATNFGPYTLDISADAIYSHHKASEATSTIFELETTLSDHVERIASLEAVVESQNIEIDSLREAASNYRSSSGIIAVGGPGRLYGESLNTISSNKYVVADCSVRDLNIARVRAGPICPDANDILVEEVFYHPQACVSFIAVTCIYK